MFFKSSLMTKLFLTGCPNSKIYVSNYEGDAPWKATQLTGPCTLDIICKINLPATRVLLFKVLDNNLTMKNDKLIEIEA